MRIGYGTSITVPVSAERWYSEINAGRAFVRGQNIGALAANFNEVQLFNPLASGKTITVYRALCSTAAIDGIYCRTHNTALATLVGNGINLQSGGAAGVGELRTAQVGALDGTNVTLLLTVANTPIERFSVWAWQLDPGEGILLTAANVNIGLSVEYYWNEV